ncbi:hypothetical protein H0H92_000120 [Tricholoma furcatifolium]|nr:hypothetical protein H0H92_000120 [Tricholoma furcatifolium]
MNVRILNLPYEVNEWDVTRHIAKIVHANGFAPPPRDEHTVQRPINFKVKLHPSKAGGVGNDGSGILTLPTEQTGNKFLKWVEDTPLKISAKKVKFRRGGHPRPFEGATLDKTPYIDPDVEEEHQKKVWQLSDKFRVNVVQFGTFYRPGYPANDQEALKPRAFSVEWESRYDTDSEAWLSFEYEHKLIRIVLGSDMKHRTGLSIAINFSSIHKIAAGYDGDPYICFDALTPPVLEEIDFHRSLTGDKDKDNKKFKRRIGALHPGHKVVAPYSHHLRLLLYNESTDVPKRFKELCIIAGLAESRILLCYGRNNVEADRLGFFAPKRLYNLQRELKCLPWSVAFQLESLLHNCLLNTEDLSSLLKKVQILLKSQGRDERYVSTLLRHYHERLEVRSLRQSPLACFQEALDTFTSNDSKLPSGNFLCCHVTFTPTRMILEGPYATQSNRVIRLYEDYLDHFVRVEFRDEDRLQYRWSREVDGSFYLQERVGGILKDGFELAGRNFEFLAYSSSALREHSVWFMNPFRHPKEGLVNSDYIRQTLGDFKDTQLLKQPSKYAARLAQAFTATDPSVKIYNEEWEEVDDLGYEPYLFTDGVGTIAKSLANEIWAALCSQRHGREENSVVQPSAYQIRFLGYKGVVGVDEQLDKHPNGIRMRLRGSMKKFSVSSPVDGAMIEIAQSFERPTACYLNRELLRPLIMILEDLGVRLDSFIELQENAVADARTIHDSSSQFQSVLNDHNLGQSYRLSHLLLKISKELQLELHPKHPNPGYDNDFFSQLRGVAMMDVLRDIKHNARILIPESFLLVGVADEGPAYKAAGVDNVYTLDEGNIFVQRVRAIGKPPEGMLCLFAHMKNVVVLPSVASKLGGGDLDGDQFSVIFHDPLLPVDVESAASYESAGTWTVERDSTVEDICDFIVEYIRSDVLGLLSDRLLVIAGIIIDVALSHRCLMQAVDYPKQGIPVDIDELPRTLIRCKPDWHAAEVISPRITDYYESDRALGVLYRSITFSKDEEEIVRNRPNNYASQQLPLTDPITLSLKDRLKPYLDFDARPIGIAAMFRRYVNELNYICATHVLSNAPDSRLIEAEVVVGTILAKCSQKRWRKDRIYRMRLHALTLVQAVQRQLAAGLVNDISQEEAVGVLAKAWAAWEFSQNHNHQFGACSFGLIALGIIFDCMDKLGGVHIPDLKDSVELPETFEDDTSTISARNMSSSPPPEVIERRKDPTKVFMDKDGKPICIFLHKSIKMDWQRRNLTEAIEGGGGEVRLNDTDVDTVLVDERYCNKDNIQIAYNGHSDAAKRKIWVEALGFVQRCIGEGYVRHKTPLPKGMGGLERPYDRDRASFTREDDDNLARWLAIRIPDAMNGGRRGEGVYRELDLAFSEDPKEYAWTQRHTWSSWRNRYNKRPDYFVDLIQHYVNSLEPTSKQAYGLQRKRKVQGIIKIQDSEEESPEEESQERHAKRRRIKHSLGPIENIPLASNAKGKGKDTEDDNSSKPTSKRAYGFQRKGRKEIIEIVDSEEEESAERHAKERRTRLSPGSVENVPSTSNTKGKGRASHQRLGAKIIANNGADYIHHSPWIGDRDIPSEPGPSQKAPINTYASRRSRQAHDARDILDIQSSQTTLVGSSRPTQPSLSGRANNPDFENLTQQAAKAEVIPTSSEILDPPNHYSPSPKRAIASEKLDLPKASKPKPVRMARRPRTQPSTILMQSGEPPYRNTRASSRSRSVEPSAAPLKSRTRRKKDVTIKASLPQLEESVKENDETNVLLSVTLQDNGPSAQHAETLEEEQDVAELLVNDLSTQSIGRVPVQTAPEQGRIGGDSNEPVPGSVSMDFDDAQADQWLRQPPALARTSHASSKTSPEEMLSRFQGSLTQSTIYPRSQNDRRTGPNQISMPTAASSKTPTQKGQGTPAESLFSHSRRQSITSDESFPISGTKASAAKKSRETEAKHTPFKPLAGTKAQQALTEQAKGKRMLRSRKAVMAIGD